MGWFQNHIEKLTPEAETLFAQFKRQHLPGIDEVMDEETQAALVWLLEKPERETLAGKLAPSGRMTPDDVVILAHRVRLGLGEK